MAQAHRGGSVVRTELSTLVVHGERSTARKVHMDATVGLVTYC